MKLNFKVVTIQTVAQALLASFVGFSPFESQAVTCKKAETRPEQPCGGINATKIHLTVDRFREQETYGGCYPTFHDYFGTAKLIKVVGHEETRELKATGYFIDQVPFELGHPDQGYTKIIVYNRKTNEMRVSVPRDQGDITFPEKLDCE